MEVKRIVQSTPVFDPWTSIQLLNYDTTNRINRLLTQPEAVQRRQHHTAILRHRRAVDEELLPHTVGNCFEG